MAIDRGLIMQSSGYLSFAKRITLAVAAVSSFALAGAASAAQLVEPYDSPTGGTELTNINRYGGQTVQFYGRYSATGSQNGQESGLGLKVKYDKTKFTTVVVDQVMMKCSIASSPGFDSRKPLPQPARLCLAGLTPPSAHPARWAGPQMSTSPIRTDASKSLA